MESFPALTATFMDIAVPLFVAVDNGSHKYFSLNE